MTFRPKFITFDCHGTMILFDMAGAARDFYADQFTPEQMNSFITDFSAYRLDAVLGAWRPYKDIVHEALERTCKLHNIPFDPAIADKIYDRVPSWGPHADVPAGLAKIAPHTPLVALTNSMNSQIPSNIANLGAPIAHVYTAEDAQAYKPRMRPFEYMLDQLGCGPEDILHVSSSFRYDLLTAHDLKIKNKVWVNRGHEPRGAEFYGYTEIKDISELPGLVGL